MNNMTSITYLFLIIAPFFFGCNGPAKEDNKNNASASSESIGEKYNIDTKESVVAWKGSMLIGSSSHTGYVYISKGDLMIENSRLVGGTAEVDMNTIEDESHKSDSGLIKHLKNADFFDVKLFPVSKITITNVVPTNGEDINVMANLTIKNITNPVVFTAKMEVKDGIAKMNGRLVIDRTLWGVRYKSGKFYDLIADETMSDYIEFDIGIVAKH